MLKSCITFSYESVKINIPTRSVIQACDLLTNELFSFQYHVLKKTLSSIVREIEKRGLEYSEEAGMNVYSPSAFYILLK